MGLSLQPVGRDAISGQTVSWLIWSTPTAGVRTACCWCGEPPPPACHVGTGSEPPLNVSSHLNSSIFLIDMDKIMLEFIWKDKGLEQLKQFLKRRIKWEESFYPISRLITELQ